MNFLPEQIFSKSAQPAIAQHDFTQFLESYQRQLGREFICSPKAPTGFLKIFGNSRFLPRFLFRHPEVINGILNSPFLHQLKEADVYQREIQVIPCSSFADWLQAIRVYKYQELTRITIKDLSGIEPATILTELSDLASTLLQAVDAQTFLWSESKWGKPLRAEGGVCAYHLLMLGKLGGRELNYSSDIDLLVITETDAGATTQGLSLHEFFVKHVQALKGFMEEMTAEGFLYRVDLELRPEGRSGTLVNSLSALENYYEVFGADWERQALSKARPGAGSIPLGEEFIRRVSPFVYPRYYAIEGLASMVRMKQKVHEELTKKNRPGFHVKLGIGGIREIEFFVQSLQIIFGGREPTLRHTNTLESITRLEHARLMSKSDAEILRKSYLFLRQLEHRLQIVEELQTHLLSDESEEQIQVAKRMGYTGEDELILKTFSADLQQVTTGVQSVFNKLFAAEEWTLQTKTLYSEEDPEELFAMREALGLRLHGASNLEEKINLLRFFKKEQEAEIQKVEKNVFSSRRRILLRLSRVAELICQQALNLATLEIENRFGKPTYVRGGKLLGQSQLVVLGMGKLGGMEINYGSDLDVIFIYSEPGTTDGKQKISNSEFFARLTQKFIFILTMLTPAGIGYSIDTELRPSGNQGPLVTTLEAFMEYQKSSARTWERQSLLKARPIAGNAHLASVIQSHLHALLYSTSFPASIGLEMHHLRMRVEKELGQETDLAFDFKKGRGALMDIEFILQYLQMTQGAQYPTLREVNTFVGLDALIQLGILGEDEANVFLKEAYTFYRTLESKLYLLTKRKINRIVKGDDFLNKLSQQLEFKSGDDLWQQCLMYREKVRSIYDKVFL
ncbi:MAG: hypothetical protein HYU97_03735 [Deltaproteobacteria bacterium]|nr:hypothetical protein [Deltaproteobacteria bacterium]